MDFGEVIGSGTVGTPESWIGAQTNGEGFRESPNASAAAAVRAFFQAATGTGGGAARTRPVAWVSRQLLRRVRA